MELAPTQLNQNVSRSLLGFDGNIMAIIEILKQDQLRVVTSLGDLDFRLKIFQAVAQWILPIPETRALVARNALMRIGYTLLPEI